MVAAIFGSGTVWEVEAPAEPEKQARQEPRPPKLLNFQIPCADAKFLLPNLVELPGRSLVERDNLELLIELEQQGQFSLTSHLSERSLLFGDHGEPAAYPFFDRDNRHADGFGLRHRIQSIDHAPASFAVGVFQERRTIRVEKDHSADSEWP